MGQKNRGAGEFAVFKRGNSYVARYRLPISADGKRRRKSFTAPTRKEAIAQASAFRDKVEKGLHLDKAATSFGEYVAEWLESEAERKSYRPNTVKSYSTIVKAIVGEIGTIKMEDLTSYHIDRGLYSTKAGSVAPSARWKLLKMICKHAYKRKVIDSNPLDFMDAPKATPAKETRCLSAAELSLLINTAERLGILASEIKTLAGTGVRIGELRALKWDDLDPEIPAIQVSKTAYEIKGTAHIGPTKTKNGNRSVEISEPLLRELEAHRARQEAQAILSPIVRVGRLGYMDRSDENLMFPNAVGRIYGSTDFNRQLAKVAKASGIDDPKSITPHVFRHTHCTLALKAGMDLFHLSRRVGHSSIVITANIYGHVSLHSQAKGATVIDSLLESTDG